MKKIILIFITTILLTSCKYAVMNEKDYIVLDTLEISRNFTGNISKLRVLIMFTSDSTIHYGIIKCSDLPDKLITVNPLPIKLN